MQTLQLDQMPVSEKFLMMERLWENLSQEASNNGFTPKWHIEILNERERRVESGESNFSSLTDVKNRLHAFVNKY